MHAYSGQEGKVMPDLYVKCKKCGFHFASSIAMDKKSFETSIVASTYLKCPRCGTRLQYNKEDYFFKK